MKSWIVKNKYWVIAGGIILITLIIILIVYLVKRQRKKSIIEKLKNIQGGVVVEDNVNNQDNTTQPPISNSNTSNSTINYSARGVVHTEKRLNDLRAILNDIQPKGDKLIYKPDGHTIGTDAGNFVWITSYRNVRSLRSGITNDSSLNQATKDYLFNKLSEYEIFAQSIFNPNKYNDKQKWAIDILKKYNDPPNYFYDK